MATGLAEGTREARNFLGAHARRRKSSEQFRWGEGSGIGFTWQHPAHLYFRRARAAQNLLGPTAAHHRLLERLDV